MGTGTVAGDVLVDAQASEYAATNDENGHSFDG
jgi:hypothetical protein